MWVYPLKEVSKEETQELKPSTWIEGMQTQLAIYSIVRGCELDLGKDCILLDRENSPLPLLLEAGPVVDSCSGSEMGMVSKLSSMAICLKSKIPLPPSVILKGFCN